MPNDHKWVKCLVCGYEMDADLKDCSCEECGSFDWSEPYVEEQDK